MPYIKKDELKNLLMNAFNKGFISALAMDHEENTPEYQCGIDFENYYEKYVSR